MADRIEIEGFPDYCIEPDGSVYRIDIRGGQTRYTLRRPSFTRDGSVKITLYRDGEAYTRSLPLLVARAHLYNDWDPDIFDTPIHLDNDLAHNHVDNLAWRPRWFAVKYQEQYWNPEYRYAKIPVEDEKTGEIFERVMEPCQKWGLLFTDVLASCTQGKEVFPTWRTFRFVD